MIELDKLSLSKQNAMAAILFPTKKENAERSADYFYSAINSAWFLFRPSVPENVKSEILSILKGESK